MNDDVNNLDERDSYDNDLAKGEDAEHNSKVRKRIDDLLEKKRLKYLLDESEDWDV